MQKPKQGAQQAKEFGLRVKDARLALAKSTGQSISQERLADLCGLHRTYVGHVERGEVNVALFNILKLAKALNIDPAELVQGLEP